MSDLIFQKKHVGIGKRKQATARVLITQGTGNLIINNCPGNKYLQYNESNLNKLWAPLKVLNLESEYDIRVLVKGGGLTSQASAIQLGLARQLCSLNLQNRNYLKPFRFLTRDSRIKERKKYGLRKARKAPQYSKR